MKTQIRQREGVTILTPVGKIVGNEVLEFRETIAPEIEISDIPRILINLEYVNKVDSAGLGALMEAHAIARRKKGRIGVINVGKQIHNLIILSRLSSIFEHFENEDAAVSELSD